MHDPSTVAFELRRPWPTPLDDHDRKAIAEGRTPFRFRPAIVTIWHEDPERRGDDDSCGWSYPRISPKDRELCRELAAWELLHPYYFNRPRYVADPNYAYPSIGPGDAAALTLALWATFAWRLDRKTLSPRLAMEAMECGVAPNNNFQSTFALDDSRDWTREEQMADAFALVCRAYRRATRPWYKHPRWHVVHWRRDVLDVDRVGLLLRCRLTPETQVRFWEEHPVSPQDLATGRYSTVPRRGTLLRVTLWRPIVGWRVQVHFIQNLKRWLFTRCHVCGGRFGWGQSGVGTWHGKGPQWFRSEQLTHSRCAGQGGPAQATPRAVEVQHG